MTKSRYTVRLHKYLCHTTGGELDMSSVFDSEMIEDDVIPALEMAM
jgi:hypothetical protein